MSDRIKALLADDEPVLLEGLAKQLTLLWPELEIVARAGSGREAVELFEALMPEICFLDVRMPGLSGVEAARFIGDRAHIVFVTKATPSRPSRRARWTTWSSQRLRSGWQIPSPGSWNAWRHVRSAPMRML